MSDDKPREPALQPGADVDNYKVVRLVGRGGMGEVYLARDTMLGRKVALKVLLPDALGDRESIDQFLFEARVTARFSHPHIVAIYGVGEHQGRPYVALEYLEGQNLRDRIRESRLGVIEAARAALAVAEALTEAHAHKILHRDLKPANVLIPRDGRLRVVDFGLAKALSERASVFEYKAEDDRPTPMPDEFDPAEARMSQLMGTPAYMAPEQWSSDDPEAPSDIWALGVMLYEMLTGKRPYNERTVYLQCAAVCSNDPILPMAVDEKIPQALEDIVFACLDRDLTKRPPASEVAEALHGIVYKRARLEGEVSPFRGLLPFTERHAELFFGRDDEVSAFIERLRDDPVLAVVGPSGAGKSSFVQAGVIPRLREQGRWVVLPMRPGREPFESLAARVARGESGGFTSSLAGPTTSPGDRSARSRSGDRTRRRAEEQQLKQQLLDSPGVLSLKLHEMAERENARVLLFIDQLEELYTLVEQEDVRRRFMEAIAEAADDAEGPVRVVLTLRDDFMVRLAETRQARQALGNVAVLRSPGPNSLNEILSKPLEQVGYRYEDPSLVDAMVEAVGGEPACLPLLQFACSRLWEERDRGRRVLRRSAYESMGGVEGALARQADRTLEGLTSEQLAIARDILLRLVTPEGARRVVPRDELTGGAGQQAEEIVDELIRERTLLVRKGRGGAAGAEVELVHESLIRGWDRLRHWIEDSREELTFLAEVEQAAELWERRGRRDEEVWQRDALYDAVRKAERLIVAPEVVRRFIAAGQRLERRRANRKRIAVAGGMMVLLLAAVASLVIALTLADKEQRAQEQRKRAEERRAEALLEGARAALARGDQHESRAKLRGSLEVTDSALGRALWWNLKQEPMAWKGRFPSTVYDISYAPDGRRIAVAHLTNAVSVIDINTREVQSLRGTS
ncbi:MAG: protein kinase, partial [Deltaproteobacteria bacterium]|nr:protein kinase [Deltaproteobacteria bacterium]